MIRLLPTKRHRYRVRVVAIKLLTMFVFFGNVRCQDQYLMKENHRITVTPGSNLTLRCCPQDPRPVDWHVRHPGSMTITVCAMGYVAEGLQHRLYLDRSDPGCYHLVINNYVPADDGLYQCIENGGLGKTTITYEIETASLLSLAGVASTTENNTYPTEDTHSSHGIYGLLAGIVAASFFFITTAALIRLCVVCRRNGMNKIRQKRVNEHCHPAVAKTSREQTASLTTSTEDCRNHCDV